MSSAPSSVHKVILAGDPQVGKTALLQRWTVEGFSEEYEPTVSPELTTKDISVDLGAQNGGQTVVRLQVWDMGFGEPDAATQFPPYVAGASGAVLMYDCTDAGSVDGVMHWHTQVQGLLGTGVVFLVAACKTDLRAAPGVVEKAKAFCDSIDAVHMDTSARGGSSAMQLFEILALEVKRKTSATKAPSPLPIASASAAAASAHARAPRATSNGVGAHPQPAVQKVSSGPPAIVSEIRAAAEVGKPVALKLVLVGDPCVGKSQIAQRLGLGPESSFQEDYIPTAGPEILTRQVSLDGVNIVLRLQVWDAAGQDLSGEAKIAGAVLQDAAAALIVYDLTQRESFESIGDWLRVLRTHAGSDLAVALVGNKVDKVEADASRRMVSIADATAHAKAFLVPAIELSAKTQPDLAGLLDTLLSSSRSQVNWAALDEAASPKATSPSHRPNPGSRLDPAATLQQTVPVKLASQPAPAPMVPRSSPVLVPDAIAATAPVSGFARDQTAADSAAASRPVEPRIAEPLPRRGEVGRVGSLANAANAARASRYGVGGTPTAATRSGGTDLDNTINSIIAGRDAGRDMDDSRSVISVSSSKAPSKDAPSNTGGNGYLLRPRQPASESVSSMATTPIVEVTQGSSSCSTGQAEGKPAVNVNIYRPGGGSIPSTSMSCSGSAAGQQGMTRKNSAKNLQQHLEEQRMNAAGVTDSLSKTVGSQFGGGGSHLTIPVQSRVPYSGTSPIVGNAASSAATVAERAVAGNAASSAVAVSGVSDSGTTPPVAVSTAPGRFAWNASGGMAGQGGSAMYQPGGRGKPNDASYVNMMMDSAQRQTQIPGGTRMAASQAAQPLAAQSATLLRKRSPSPQPQSPSQGNHQIQASTPQSRQQPAVERRPAPSPLNRATRMTSPSPQPVRRAELMPGTPNNRVGAGGYNQYAGSSNPPAAGGMRPGVQAGRSPSVQQPAFRPGGQGGSTMYQPQAGRQYR